MKFIGWRVKPDSKRRIVIPIPAYRSLDQEGQGPEEIEIKKKKNMLILTEPTGKGEERKISRNSKEVVDNKDK